MTTALPGALAWCDGACEPNPGGIGGWGFFIELPEGGDPITDYGVISPRESNSNNFLEFCAVGAAIKTWQLRARKETLHVHTDSKLVVETMNGRWKAKQGSYLVVYDRLVALRKTLDFVVTFTWVPRERNTRADELSKKGIREREVSR